MLKKASAKRKLTRVEQRDLDIEIGFMEGLLQRDPKYIEALQVLGDAYTRRGKISDGLRVDEQVAALRPRDPLALYNLACSYSITKQVDRAVAVLSRAIDRGYNDFKSLIKDPDLADVRKHPLFKKIQAKIRSAKIRVH